MSATNLGFEGQSTPEYPRADPILTELDAICDPHVLTGGSKGLAGFELVYSDTSEEVTPLYEEAYTKEYSPESGDLEVHVKSHVTLADYERVTPPEEWQRLREYARAMQGKRLAFINATAAGGGVAIMRAPLIHLYQQLGIDAHWYALSPNEEGSKVTKWKFHNVMQDVAPEGTELTEEDQSVYESWIDEEAEKLKEPMAEADVIVIDDWQPSRLIRYIKGYQQETPDGVIHHKGINPDAPILLRDHIQTEGELMVTPGTPQNTTWKYLWENNGINLADVFITHPKDEFVPPNVPNERVVFMPATCDILDDLNRPLTNAERERGFEFINEQLALSEDQLPLDLSRPYIVLIARFDESKGMPQGIESYAKARTELLSRGVSEQDLPQFVLLGNGSVDDPSGTLVLKDIMNLRRESYGEIKDDLKVVRVPHNDTAINALLKGAKIALQPSTKEGFESRVTDAILQDVPVIGSDRGGIPLQIEHGESGFVIDPYDTDNWSQYIADLITNTALYDYMKERVHELAQSKNYAFTTVPNAQRWLWLSHAMLSQPRSEFQGNRRTIEEMAA